MRPGGRNADDCFFEVAVDRSEIDSEVTWGLVVNCTAEGSGGVRFFVWNWGAVNNSNADGIAFGDSNGPFSSLGTVTRIAANPAGWTSAGTHKVGVYHARDCAYGVFDGVRVFKIQNIEVDCLGQGGYVGVCGDTQGVDRLHQSWGLAPITGIPGWS